MKLLITEVIAICVLAGLLGTGFNQLRSQKLRVPLDKKYQNPLTLPAAPAPLPSDPAPPANGDPQSPPNDDLQLPSNPDPERRLSEVSVEEAFEEYEAGGAIFIDARRSKDYSEGHIKGARLLALWEGDFEEKLEQFLNQEDPGASVLVYCSGSANCEDSHQIALRLQQAGFENVHVIRGGFPGWQSQGYPVQKGPEK